MEIDAIIEALMGIGNGVRPSGPDADGWEFRVIGRKHVGVNERLGLETSPEPSRIAARARAKEMTEAFVSNGRDKSAGPGP